MIKFRRALSGASRIFLFATFASALLPLRAERIELTWPTPNKAWEDGRSIEAYVQPTASGVKESGLFGCVRSSGGQFHEGLDIKPVKRDRQGEPVDPIFAALSGVVRYINRTAGDSSYGRYIVIEHPDQTPAVYTLYAHLSKIEAGLKAGDAVERGQTIATMGRSASGYAIPKDRAHLHWEIGLWLTRDFQSWYDWKKFGSRNSHGVFNGMNLIGFDPLDFSNQWRGGQVNNFQEYVARMTPAVKLRISTTKVPDFVARYPALLTKPVEGATIGGWEIGFNAMGVPIRWTPLTPMELVEFGPGEIRVIEADMAQLKANDCKSLVFPKRGRYAVGSDLRATLQLLFGLRREL